MELSDYFGRVIEGCTFTREKITLTFQDNLELGIYAQGDCCSTSWFEQVSGENALRPGAILNKLELVKMEEKNTIVEDTDGYEDHIKFYGVKFITNKGHTDVDMRNSSNGYYGGFLSINNDDQYGGETLHPEWD